MDISIKQEKTERPNQPQPAKSSGLERLLRFLPPILIMAAIFFFSSRTGDDLNTLLPFFRRLFPGLEGFDWGHFVAYFILGLAFCWSVTDGRFTLRSKLAAVALCFLYGLTDEFHQRFVPGRSPDWLDIRNDVIGAGLAMLVISLPGIKSLAKRMRVSIKSRK